MAKQQFMVAVSYETRDALRALAREIAADTEISRRNDIAVASENINPRCCGVTMDQVIQLLLRIRSKKNTRSAKWRAERQRKKQGGE